MSCPNILVQQPWLKCVEIPQTTTNHPKITTNNLINYSTIHLISICCTINDKFTTLGNLQSFIFIYFCNMPITLHRQCGNICNYSFFFAYFIGFFIQLHRFQLLKNIVHVIIMMIIINQHYANSTGQNIRPIKWQQN